MILAAILAGWRVADYYTTDNRPALVIHSFQQLNRVVLQGADIEYQAVYSKRAECHPPRGNGEVRYRFRSLSQTKDGDHRGAVIVESPVMRQTVW